MRQLSVLLIFLQLSQAQATIEAVFNTPGFTGQPSTTIHKKIIQTISQAAPGSAIRGSFYLLNYRPLTIELLKASARGVDIQLVFDGNTKKATSSSRADLDLLLQGDGSYAPLKCAAESCIKFCSGIIKGISKAGGACKGLAVNHNKFLLFSNLKNGDQNVVLQTSANMTNGQTKMYQDLLIIKDARLYNLYMNYWLDLKGLPHEEAPEIDVLSPEIQVRFFPKLLGKDPVANLFEKISCHRPGSKIRIVQSVFTRGNVAEGLRRLIVEGCDVKVIVRDDEKQSSPGKEVLAQLGPETLIILPWERANEESAKKNSIHSKIILVDAEFKKTGQPVKMVVTGSHNLDLFSLRTNDEVLLYIKDDRLFNQYLSFWQHILDDALDAGLIEASHKGSLTTTSQPHY